MFMGIVAQKTNRDGSKLIDWYVISLHSNLDSEESFDQGGGVVKNRSKLIVKICEERRLSMHISSW